MFFFYVYWNKVLSKHIVYHFHALFTFWALTIAIMGSIGEGRGLCREEQGNPREGRIAEWNTRVIFNTLIVFNNSQSINVLKTKFYMNWRWEKLLSCLDSVVDIILGLKNSCFRISSWCCKLPCCSIPISECSRTRDYIRSSRRASAIPVISMGSLCLGCLSRRSSTMSEVPAGWDLTGADFFCKFSTRRG